MDESTFDTVLPESTPAPETTKPPVPMSNVEQTVIAIAIALIIVFASSAATLMKK
jgi:hypothetical protein